MSPKYPPPDIPPVPSSRRRSVPSVDNEMLDELAKKIRGIYIVRRREWEERLSGGTPSKYLPGNCWDGGRYRGQNRQNIWLKLASFVLEHNLDPYDYLRAQFFFAGCSHPRQPNQLLSKEALDDYRYNLKGEEEELAKRTLESQREHLLEALRDWQLDNKEGFTREQIQLAILRDIDLPLSALFRFCVAIDEKLDRVAEWYLLPAVMQYLSHSDAYDKVWGDWIPEWFRSAARDRLKKQLDQGGC